MSGPKRIQRKRTKGWKMPEGAVYVGRPTKWGNPFRAGAVIVDPVNSINPIPGLAYSDVRFFGLGAHQRLSVDGETYTQTVRTVTDAADAVELFRRAYEFQCYNLSSLRGRDLACWCPLDQPCHANVLLALANKP